MQLVWLNIYYPTYNTGPMSDQTGQEYNRFEWYILECYAISIQRLAIEAYPAKPCLRPRPDYPGEIKTAIHQIPIDVDTLQVNIALAISSLGETSWIIFSQLSDGAGGTETFCAIWNLLDSVSLQNAVDVFRVVKDLRVPSRDGFDRSKL